MQVALPIHLNINPIESFLDTEVTIQEMSNKPTHNDVLLGRGVATNRHPGNENFRAIVSQHVEVYVVSTKKQKTSISRSIVEKVHKELNGKFLEKNPKTGLWHEVDDKRALEKTAQALRDGAAPLRKQLSEDMSDPTFLEAVFDGDNHKTTSAMASKQADSKTSSKKNKKRSNSKTSSSSHSTKKQRTTEPVPSEAAYAARQSAPQSNSTFPPQYVEYSAVPSLNQYSQQAYVMPYNQGSSGYHHQVPSMDHHYAPMPPLDPLYHIPPTGSMDGLFSTTLAEPTISYHSNINNMSQQQQQHRHSHASLTNEDFLRAAGFDDGSIVDVLFETKGQR